MNRIAVVVLALAAGAAPLRAQERPASRFQAALSIPAATLVAPPAQPTVVSALTTVPGPSAPATGWSATAPGRSAASSSRAGEAAAEQGSSGFFSFRNLAHFVGGAIVGGWVGYVGAQVAHSDWDKESDGSLSNQRSTWVAGGMVLGMVGSRLIGHTSPPRPDPLVRQPRASRNILTLDEIRGSTVSDAYDLIQSLRKDWLVTRGTNSWSETARGTLQGSPAAPSGTIVPGRDQIIVYLDDTRIGGVDALHDVSASLLTRAEFLDGRQATFRFGSGHAHGAILLFTGNAER